jgi:hypothetical protein
MTRSAAPVVTLWLIVLVALAYGILRTGDKDPRAVRLGNTT